MVDVVGASQGGLARQQHPLALASKQHRRQRTGAMSTDSNQIVPGQSSLLPFFQEHAIVSMVQLSRATPLLTVYVTEGNCTPVELPVVTTGLCLMKRQ
jgi:hypothetical protein